MMGCTGDTNALCIKDLYTSLKMCYPLKDKTARTTVAAFKDFIGPRRARQVYSDGSGEIEKACMSLGLLDETAQPGVPATNGIA